MLISSNTFFSSIYLHVSMQHGKLLTEIVAVSYIQDEIITNLPQLKAILGHKSCAVSNLFSCLDFQFHFVCYNSRLLT